MGIPKSSSGIDELIPGTYEDGDETAETGTARKADRKLLKLRNPQAWRALEDRLDELRLKRKLREIYEED